MKKFIVTILVVIGIYTLWKFIKAARQEKLSLSESGQKVLQTVKSAFETNIRVPVIAQVGQKPLTGYSQNPVSSSFGTNAVYQTGPKQLAPRQAGSLQFSAIVDPNKKTTSVVPERFSADWFKLMAKDLQNN